VSEVVLANKAHTPKKKSREPVAARPLDKLTDTELQILESLGLGKDNPEIARNLKMTPRAVDVDVKQIRSKLKFKTDNALIRYAVCWVEAGEA
jgi:DNA-binding NarL/FixJ family response regulator